MTLTNKLKYAALAGSVFLSSCRAFVVPIDRSLNEFIKNNSTSRLQSLEYRVDSEGNSPIVGGPGPLEGYIPGEVRDLTYESFADFASQGYRATLLTASWSWTLTGRNRKPIEENFAKAAKKMPYIGFGKIDIGEEKELRKLFFPITNPNMLLFIDGELAGIKNLEKPTFIPSAMPSEEIIKSIEKIIHKYEEGVSSQ